MKERAIDGWRDERELAVRRLWAFVMMAWRGGRDRKGGGTVRGTCVI